MFNLGMTFRGRKPCLVITERQLKLASESFRRGLYGYYETAEMEGCDWRYGRAFEDPPYGDYSFRYLYVCAADTGDALLGDCAVLRDSRRNQWTE